MDINPLDSDPDRRARLLSAFSRLRPERFIIQSERTHAYNCVAWAAGSTGAWWWPDHRSFWPEGVARETTIEAFIAAFSTIGYVRCRSTRRRRGVEKIAIYVDQRGQPTHTARLLESGRWTSKLGNCEDIEHDFDGLTGHDNQEYGDVIIIMAKRSSSRRGILALAMKLPLVGGFLTRWVV